MKSIFDRGARLFGSFSRFANRNDTLLIGCLLAVIVFVDSIPFGMKGYSIDGHHSGNMLNGALNVLHGEPLLSRVQSIYGLFLPYVNALQLYLFGETYLALWVLPIVGLSCGLTIYYALFKDFLGSLASLLAVLIILALNKAVLTPWSNYLAFGMNGLLVWLLWRNLQKPEPQRAALFGIGVLLFISVLIRSQAILLYPTFLAAIFLYCREDWLSRITPLSLGLFFSVVGFAAKLAYDGTLYDYYLQTVAIQNHNYFGDKGVLHGLRQVFEVFTTGRAPAGMPSPPVGFGPYELFGGLWLCIFLANAYLVARVAILMLYERVDQNTLRSEVPPSILLIAMLTSIGPLFSIHNVSDNFRYALHMSQGVATVFYLIRRLVEREHARPIFLLSVFVFFAPLYSVIETTRSSVDYLLARMRNPAKAEYPKYYEGIDITDGPGTPRSFRDRLIFASRFFESYQARYPDSYVYTNMNVIADGLYAIGKFRTYHKTLTNDHFVSSYPKYYPEFAAKFDEAARSRKLIFLTDSGADNALTRYDYVKLRESHGLSIFIARERAESFSMP